MIDEGQPVSPEVRLFRSIIANAVFDAIHGTYIRNECQSVKASALKWFFEAGPDFEMICECANLHPQRVRNAALQYIRIGRDNPSEFARRAA